MSNGLPRYLPPGPGTTVLPRGSGGAAEPARLFSGPLADPDVASQATVAAAIIAAYGASTPRDGDYIALRNQATESTAFHFRIFVGTQGSGGGVWEVRFTLGGDSWTALNLGPAILL